MRRYTIIVATRPSPAPDALLPGHEFLMLRNAKRAGRLELPGGTVEPGEEPLAGARREFTEETGHDWILPELVQRRTGPLGEGYVYLCGVGGRVGEPEATTQGIEYFTRLPPRDQLSFPDDPYEDLFAAARAAHATRPGRAARP